MTEEMVGPYTKKQVLEEVYKRSRASSCRQRYFMTTIFTPDLGGTVGRVVVGCIGYSSLEEVACEMIDDYTQFPGEVVAFYYFDTLARRLLTEEDEAWQEIQERFAFLKGRHANL